MHEPGSDGERQLQERYGSERRAAKFYQNQMLPMLNGDMIDFIGGQTMMFIATADGKGECDTSFRAGPPGFVRVRDAKHLYLPEYRGNGVMASLGNISENPHIGIMFIDFVENTIGLHVNGKARILENEEILANKDLYGFLTEDLKDAGGRTPERWIAVTVEEAYIHCSKHIPRMKPVPKEIDWGTDDVRKKGGDFFHAKITNREIRAHLKRKSVADQPVVKQPVERVAASADAVAPLS